MEESVEETLINNPNVKARKNPRNSQIKQVIPKKQMKKVTPKLSEISESKEHHPNQKNIINYMDAYSSGESTGREDVKNNIP